MKQTLDGRVIAAFGRHLLVRDAGGRELRARPFGRALTVVCGDDVRCRVDARHDEVHVVEVLPRRTALYRAAQRGGAEPVVANLTRLLVVLAPLPEPDLFIVDRYLAAATAGGIAATLIVNKSDLGIDAALTAELAVYRAAHPEASPLVTQLENWLHRPTGDRNVDVARLLEPYRNIAPDALEVSSP